MNLKELRRAYNLTQEQAALDCNCPLRTYIRYEQKDDYGSSIKRQYFIKSLKQKHEIDENHGILSINEIKNIVFNTFKSYENKISYCYLFGSYAKGKAEENSDVDLCVDTTLIGLEAVGLIEELRLNLHKKIDFVLADSLPKNPDLLREIMKGGIRIYG